MFSCSILLPKSTDYRQFHFEFCSHFLLKVQWIIIIHSDNSPSYCFCTEFLSILLCFHDIQKHKLPLSYNFHKYMVRSMEDEFHGILGIRYALHCINYLNRKTVFKFKLKFSVMILQLAALGLCHSLHLHKCAW